MNPLIPFPNFQSISCMLPRMKLDKWILCLTLLVSGCGARTPEKSQAQRPNILYIMADDLGYGDLSGYGRKDYATPALDTLASQGTRFTQAYAIAPVCTPTRVGLMTGQYPSRHRAGLWEPLRTKFRNEGLDPAFPSLARRLHDAGYETGLVGKWHLGLEPGFRPTDHGFDRWFSILSGAADYVTHRATEPGDPNGPHTLYQDGKEVHTNGYLTDLFTEQAESFLRSAKPPFFLNLEYNAPHWPWQQPGDPAYPEGKDPASYGGSPEIYKGMMKALDDGVARVLAVLDELGYAENTIVVFTSDNGGERFSDMAGLKGSKTELWEGGIRVPAFARWPGVIPSGRTSEQVVTTLDWTATMLAAAGVERPKELDGMDMMAHLRGEAQVAERTVFWRSTRWGVQHAVRQGNWKYVRKDNEEFVFDLGKDPAEKENLAQKEKERLAQLRSTYEKWEAGVLPAIEPMR
jgi:arylsulfatase A-like enzyme